MLKFSTLTLPVIASLALSNASWAEESLPSTNEDKEQTSNLVSSEQAGYSFSRQTVIDLAKALAAEPMKAPQKAAPGLINLDADTYRQINFQQNQAVWGEAPTQFSIQLFAPGFLYQDLVEIDAVESGRAYPIKATTDSFVTPNENISKLIAELGKFAGLRLHYPINTDDKKDEFIVFQGASYFRAISKGQKYGVSARGLAVDVAQPKGEEFPMFRHFWIERPSSSQQAIVVHALLDSKSVTGAYRFGIFPGSPTRIEVESTLFPRRDLAHVGLAPLTSMYMFNNTMDDSPSADHRAAVHNSEGLQIQTGQGEMLWRPLTNPDNLQISAFMDESPQGFGLIQRQRQFSAYQDLEALYQRRPSIWVKPMNDWGKGHIELIEIPSQSESNDNIVAYWQPEAPLKKGQPFEYSYRLTLTNDTPVLSGQPHIVRSAVNKSSSEPQLVIDYEDLSVSTLESLQVDASISQGKIVDTKLVANPYQQGVRAFVTFDPAEADTAEIRLQLKQDNKPLAETWLYRWTGE